MVITIFRMQVYVYHRTRFLKWLLAIRNTIFTFIFQDIDLWVLIYDYLMSIYILEVWAQRCKLDHIRGLAQHIFQFPSKLTISNTKLLNQPWETNYEHGNYNLFRKETKLLEHPKLQSMKWFTILKFKPSCKGNWSITK